MNKLYAIIALLLLSLSHNAFAAQDAGYVRNVYVFANSHGFRLKEGFKNAAAEIADCGSSGNFAIIPAEQKTENNPKGNKNSDHMLSTILTAMAAGIKVRINTDSCLAGKFKVTGIYLDAK